MFQGVGKAPIIQGTFESAPSVNTHYASPLGGYDNTTYAYLSRHNYLDIHLGSYTSIMPEWGSIDGYQGIYVKGTIQKTIGVNAYLETEYSVSNGFPNTINFEHFGWTYNLPGWTSQGSTGEGASLSNKSFPENLATEFVPKSRTFHVGNDFNVISNINPIANEGGDTNLYGGQQYDYMDYSSNTPFTPYFMRYENDGGSNPEDWDIHLRCYITFAANGSNPQKVTNFIVKGTYLLL
jgi:hypothetical protein